MKNLDDALEICADHYELCLLYQCLHQEKPLLVSTAGSAHPQKYT